MTETYLSNLQQGLADALEQNESVVLLGEDILDPYGGAFKVSKGLSTRFPDRVLTTPISEAGFTGVAVGAALRGLRPIVEIMFGDFLTLTTDQLVNHAGKFRGLYAGRVTVPMMVRTPMGGGRGYGATHSQSLEKMYLGVPGLRVVAPSQFHRPGDQLSRLIQTTQGPVLFIEHKLLYPERLVHELPGFTIELRDEVEHAPTAIVANFESGQPDVTLVTYGGAARQVLELMQRMRDEEIRILAAIVSSLDPLPMATLVEVAGRTGRVLIVEEGTAGFNWGSEVASRLYESAWQRLHQPIRRIASQPKPIPCAKTLEDEVLISSGRIEEELMEALG